MRNGLCLKENEKKITMKAYSGERKTKSTGWFTQTKRAGVQAETPFKKGPPKVK